MAEGTKHKEGGILDARGAPQPQRSAKVSARVVKAGGSSLHRGIPPRAIQEDTDMLVGSLFRTAQVLEPPYDPQTLLKMWENSSALNQNIAAYTTNIDGQGWRLTPRFDFNEENAEERVRDAMWVARYRAAEALGQTPESPEELRPTDEDVQAEIERLKHRARIERALLNAFFSAVNPDGSFESLREKTRQDREITGNGYWEVLRDAQGRLSRFIQVPPTHVRCTAKDAKPCYIDERVQVGLAWETVKQPRFFRRYVQVVGRSLVWFKEFGDPRIVDAKTGKLYKDEADWVKHAPKDAQRATELVHFKIHATGEAYGLPRWVGNHLAVLGSRSADEVNYSYFDNKTIPPLALLVSGGKLDEDAPETIKNFIRDEIKGQENYHSILIIEGDEDPMAPGSFPKLKFHELAQTEEGRFQSYDERNIDKIGSSFRLPRLLRGDVRDFNRSTADASLRFADEQVFNPERNAFDAWINRRILPQLNITMWDFRSLGPQTRDPEKVAGIIVDLAKIGVLTPNEARELSSDILGRDLDPISAPWAKQPIQLTLAGFRPPGSGDSGDLSQEGQPQRPGAPAGESTLEEDDAEVVEQRRRSVESQLRELAGMAGPDGPARAALEAAATRHGADLLTFAGEGEDASTH